MKCQTSSSKHANTSSFLVNTQRCSFTHPPLISKSKAKLKSPVCIQRIAVAEIINGELLAFEEAGDEREIVVCDSGWINGDRGKVKAEELLGEDKEKMKNSAGYTQGLLVPNMVIDKLSGKLEKSTKGQLSDSAKLPDNPKIYIAPKPNPPAVIYPTPKQETIQNYSITDNRNIEEMKEKNRELGEVEEGSGVEGELERTLSGSELDIGKDIDDELDEECTQSDLVYSQEYEEVEVDHSVREEDYRKATTLNSDYQILLNEIAEYSSTRKDKCTIAHAFDLSVLKKYIQHHSKHSAFHLPTPLLERESSSKPCCTFCNIV
eukprot:TRINITY_DN2495_c0_g2_i2.p1 TRINITY_DN2495_c0_g2~~TRINITY_DN2495_c0_g2_i2.p1  ORF type:complete len:320 (+),score=30.42 TRINITY_DN2495_c0_g2_i2:430-1389(+)